METNFNEQDQYLRAQKQVEELKGFYGHLASYIVVNTGLIVLNLATSPHQIWFIWPLVGWGIGLAFHAMRVFNFSPFFGKDWEERKIREFMKEEIEKSKKFNETYHE